MGSIVSKGQSDLSKPLDATYDPSNINQAGSINGETTSSDSKSDDASGCIPNVSRKVKSLKTSASRRWTMFREGKDSEEYQRFATETEKKANTTPLNLNAAATGSAATSDAKSTNSEQNFFANLAASASKPVAFTAKNASAAAPTAAADENPFGPVSAQATDASTAAAARRMSKGASK